MSLHNRIVVASYVKMYTLNIRRRQMGKLKKEYSRAEIEEAVRRSYDGGTPIGELVKELEISKTTLYNWRKDIEGIPRSANRTDRNNRFSSEARYYAVLETGHMTETEKAEYCRQKGILIEELREWEEICKGAYAEHIKRKQFDSAELRKEKKEKAELARELRRKDKALAEAAALMLLQKKAQAIWGDPEGE